MAVPKKKTSYSKVKNRYFANNLKKFVNVSLHYKLLDVINNSLVGRYNINKINNINKKYKLNLIK